MRSLENSENSLYPKKIQPENEKQAFTYRAKLLSGGGGKSWASLRA